MASNGVYSNLQPCSWFVIVTYLRIKFPETEAMLSTYIICVAANCDYNILQATTYILTVMGKRKIPVFRDVTQCISLKVTFPVDFQRKNFYIPEDGDLRLKFYMIGKFYEVKLYTVQSGILCC